MSTPPQRNRPHARALPSSPRSTIGPLRGPAPPGRARETMKL